MSEFFDDYLNEAVSVGLYLLAIAVFYGALRFLSARVDKTRDRFFEQVIHHLSGPAQVLFLILGAFVVSQQFRMRWIDGDIVQNGFVLVLVAALTWLAVRVVQLFSRLTLRRFNMDARDNLNARMMHTQVRVMRRLVIAIILIIGTASALMVFEQIRALGVSLLASAGVAGVIIGFAAQKTIGNFFTGLQIAVTQPIRIDDAVVVEGEWGWIEEINLTYVVVKIWDQRRLVLPITYFVEQPFQNWTRTTADILGSVVLYLDYAMPVQAIRDELDRILAETDLWDGKVKVAQVIDTTEKTMTVRVLVSAADSPTAWDLRCLVRERLVTFVQQHYPQCLPRFRAELPDMMPSQDREHAA